MAERRSASSSTSSSSDSTPLSPKVHSLMNEKPALKIVCAIVRTSKWHQLGIQLGIDSEMLHDIESEKSETQDKRTQMFRLWIASQPEASHNQLVEALRLKVIGEDRMAQEYEEKVKEEASKTTETNQIGMYHKVPITIKFSQNKFQNTLKNLLIYFYTEAQVVQAPSVPAWNTSTGIHTQYTLAQSIILSLLSSYHCTESIRSTNTTSF